MNWPRDKLDEIYTVKRFLDNAGVRFQFNESNIYTNYGEPVDVFVADINKKFQIVIADFRLAEALGKTKAIKGVKMVTFTRRIEDALREFIIRPIQKKSKYGKAAQGIILLINSHFEPPFIEKHLPIWKKVGLDHELKRVGFDEIYLVCIKKNIKIYP